MAKHTDGEWTLVRDDRHEHYSITAPAEDGLVYVIAEIGFGFTGPFEAEQHANAALLVQAKNLLGMVQRYASECPICNGIGRRMTHPAGVQGDCLACTDIRALIAKAGG